MRPYDPDTLVKPVYDDNNADEVNSDNEDEDNTDDDDSDGDSDSSSDEPVCIRTRSQRKKQESPIENNTNDTENTVKVTTDGPEAQEIDRQSDSDSFRSVDSGSDGADGHVGTHSPPLALRRSTREKKLPCQI